MPLTICGKPLGFTNQGAGKEFPRRGSWLRRGACGPNAGWASRRPSESPRPAAAGPPAPGLNGGAGFGAKPSRAVAPARHGAAAFLVVVAGLCAVSTAAQAQRLTSFVSNTGATEEPGVVNGIEAQNFKTGANADGYTVSDVRIQLGNATGAQTRVRIRENNTSSRPGELVAELTNPGTLTSNRLNSFTAPADTRLDPETTYWIPHRRARRPRRHRLARRLPATDAARGRRVRRKPVAQRGLRPALDTARTRSHRVVRSGARSGLPAAREPCPRSPGSTSPTGGGSGACSCAIRARCARGNWRPRRCCSGWAHPRRSPPQASARARWCRARTRRCCWAPLLSARARCDPRAAMLLPAVLATMHLAWAGGFLAPFGGPQQAPGAR